MRSHRKKGFKHTTEGKIARDSLILVTILSFPIHSKNLKLERLKNQVNKKEIVSSFYNDLKREKCFNIAFLVKN